ncbi:MAG TPA: multiheme c-type cytochrome ExtKL, partial [Thermodesulfovibrionales bacterium]|nr:multiheme c-type cytochrome ExtKL [Thermodesulfovibrionales bacterium]
YISGGGTKSCLDCHMQKGDHLIAPNFNDDKGTSELLAKSIILEVDTLGYEWLRKAATYVPKIVVSTKITNKAGHRVPDG